MDERCSCGTVLVADSLFCHRCGKPQRDLIEAVELQPVIAAPVSEPTPQITAPQPVGFTNAVAVRVGFLTAAVSSMLMATPLLNLLFIVWSALAGYFSVVLYRKRTGESLTVRAGAKLGWITGVLNSLIILVFFTLNVLMTNAEPIAKYHEGIAKWRLAAPKDYEAMGSLVESPFFIAAVVLFFFFMFAAVLTVAGITGGAVSAKVSRKE